MEQQELINEAARLINYASKMQADERPAQAREELVKLYELLRDEFTTEPVKPPEEPAAHEQP